MAQQSGASTSSSTTTQRGDGSDDTLKPKHEVFLSHSGVQKPFVENLCLGFERCFRYPFFDKRPESLRIGDSIPQHIFHAIRECHIGVVILSEDFLTSKWPMMELVAMHSRVLDEEGKEKSNLKIIPVFLHTSPKEFDNPASWSRWRSCWDKLAMKYPKRVQVEKWEAALKYLHSLKGLVYNGPDQISFQNEIVDDICRLVPPEIKWEDSHIQGRSRLCKVIRDEIDMLQENTKNGVCVLGLYGVGGVGKTTICKALCNEFLTRFGGRVCHAELEKGSEKELLRELLKSLTNKSHVHIDGLNVDQMRYGLKEGLINEPVFLALDNMSDSDGSIQQVKSYLSARLPFGSIVMVTARSKDWLKRVRPHIDESNCLEMPELEEDEAKSLFIKSCDFELRNDISEELILRCIRQCHFSKNDGSHYHPLALDVLGRQLARLDDPKQWALELDRINEDIFNHSEEIKHLVFSILRTSFDTLSARVQLLFMDVALFLPKSRYWAGLNVFEWLRIVHGMPRVGDVLRALERLKAKSLVEGVDDRFERRIGMHDLWCAFCEAETKYGELSWRCWLYVAKDISDLELVESSPCGTCWENVKRMAVLDYESRSLERANFAQFSNVALLTIQGTIQMTKLVVALSELIHLKSLDVSGLDLEGSNGLVLQGLPQSLIFLRLVFYESTFLPQQGIEENRSKTTEIACLKELQYLELYGFRGSKLPDMRSMVSLRVAIFTRCKNVVTVAGLSSKLTRLRILDLEFCSQLRRCPGVGDLVALEELNYEGCRRLEKLPNLQKLRNLRKLNISWCNLITEVPGLGDLVALEELHAEFRLDQLKLLKLPDMRNLTNLKVLDLRGRSLEGTVPRLDNSISLQGMVAYSWNVVDKPNPQPPTNLQEVEIVGLSSTGLRGIAQLTNLQNLEIAGLSSTELRGIDNLVMLQSLDIGSCSGADEVPEFWSLTRLRTLVIRDCEFKDVSGLSSLSTLKTLFCSGLPIIEEMPDLDIFLRLERLELMSCASLRGLTSREHMNALSELAIYNCTSLATLPDLCTFPVLVRLRLSYCKGITMLSSSVPMNTLDSISLKSCSGLKALPDLAMFPRLTTLDVFDCRNLAPLSTSVPLPALSWVSSHL